MPGAADTDFFNKAGATTIGPGLMNQAQVCPAVTMRKLLKPSDSAGGEQGSKLATAVITGVIPATRHNNASACDSTR